MRPTIELFSRSSLSPALLTEVAGFAAACNRDPAQHIGYLGEQVDDVTAELRELDGDPVFAVAREGSGDGATMYGLLCAEWDLDLGRTWLHGPWAPTDELMDRLYQAVLPRIPPQAVPHELFGDAENTTLADFAARHGFARHGEQAILRFHRAKLAELEAVSLPKLGPRWREQVAELHDRAFPGTYAPSRVLLDGHAPVLVAADGDTLLGYVTLKLRPEYSETQIEYLAVAEAARGSGVGARLVAAALHEAFTDDRYQVMDLVVDQDNPAARRLYERVGFTLLREMRSFRSAGVPPGAPVIG